MENTFEIKSIKINGVKDPMGFDLNEIYLSYYVVGEPKGKLTLDIFDENENKVYGAPLDYAKNYETKIDFTPKMQTRYKLVISAENGKGEACFETGTNFDCDFITPVTDISHPVIFKNFTCGKIKKARLYITGVGLYEATLNGKKVGDEYLTPYCNDYRSYLQYSAYDVTDMLKNDNLLEVALGDGWYKGRFGLNHKTNIYGSEYACALKIVVWDEDGAKTTVKSDTSFKARSSNILSSGIYDGEIRDDTIATDKESAVKLSKVKYNVTPRVSLPIVVKHEIKPKLTVTPKGESVLDFGQNFAGLVKFINFLPKGKTITLKAGEVLKDGCFFRDNLRTAKAEFVYTSDGEKKTIEPKFTFYGFRYMLVECDEKINADDFIGEALYSDLDQTSFTETDNPKINRLIQNCLWGQRSNFLDVPTDCPQRDERLGWTGDAEVFCKAACYQTDARAFYKKYLKDIAIDQKKLGGKIPNYAPDFDEGQIGASVWADAVTIVPWTVYNFYGDTDILRQSYPAMKAYLDDLIARDDEHGGARLQRFGFHLGDWLSQDGVNPSALKAATDEYFIAACYFYESAFITAETASVLGKAKDAAHYKKIAGEIHSAILNEYFTPSGKLAVDTQTAYALCVMFDIYRDKQALYDGFRERMKKDCYAIKGGFVGATKLIQALFKAGLSDAAYRMLYNEKFPGWLYCVNLGATTIWERWNLLSPDGKLNSDAMNSFNHYSFGAVSEAIYSDISGIKQQDIAFKKVTIEPKFNYRLKKFDYKFISPAGEFIVDYVIGDSGEVDYNIVVPYGVEATFIFGKTKRKLNCGKNTISLQLSNQFSYPFSASSVLCDVLENTEARETYKKIVPPLYNFFTSNGCGLEGHTLSEINDIASFHIPDKLFAALDENLKKIKV